MILWKVLLNYTNLYFLNDYQYYDFLINITTLKKNMAKENVSLDFKLETIEET